MSNMLRSPSVGPIVGHITSTSVRLWMRASDEAPGRTVGVIALYDAAGAYVAGSADYMRMHREYDRTGTKDFKELAPDTRYTARLGSLSLDSTDEMVTVEDDELWKKLPPAKAWCEELEKLPDAECLAAFRTHSAADGGPLSFVFGSCRYPGLLWAAKKADRIFGAILQKFREADAPRFLLMVGDQIYADKMNRAIILERADTPSEFHERYVTAFTSPNMRALLRSVPSYMILDDHEIEDNWVQGRIKDHEKRFLFQTAVSAYMSYQWVHSPRNFGAWGNVEGGTGDKLFYSFECCGYPFFVMDSRTQRIRDDDDHVLEDNHLLGYPAKPTAPDHKGQIDILCEWLVAQQIKHGDRPKFIVSPSVFVPNGVETAGNDERSDRKKCEDDAWAAFPTTRRQLLRAIVDNGVQNVVFLSGDVHCSNLAEITFTNRTDGSALPLRAFGITSSAFYWPWAFADGDPLSFVHDSTIERDDFPLRVNPDDVGYPDIVMSYRAHDFVQEDNFTRVDIGEKEIVVRNYDREGAMLGREMRLGVG